jgi:DNA-binding NarL/FixJ family response regulator
VVEEVSTANCFSELLEMLEKDASYHLLILDLSLTDITGSRGVAYVREHFPELPVMVFSGTDTADIIAECFEFGVQGFVSKSTSMQVLVDAIRTVLDGSVYIPPAAAGVMGAETVESSQTLSGSAAEPIRFTPKQQQVFDQLMLGVPNKIIARRLEMAEGTVKTHLHGIYQILGVNNRAQAILKSRQLQLIE